MEVRPAKGHHQFISGLPDAAVKEGLDQLKSAVHNSCFKMPDAKIIFNLGPADLQKSGSSFDLAMAIAVLGATGQIINVALLQSFIISGELGLGGCVSHRFSYCRECIYATA